MASAHPRGTPPSPAPREKPKPFLRQAETPCPMPVPQRRMLHWAEPASNHPLEAHPHPSSSSVSPTSVSAWARDPGKPNPTQNASPLLRGTPKPPARVSAQPGPAERRTRFSRTHLTPTAGSVSLPVDRPA